MKTCFSFSASTPRCERSALLTLAPRDPFVLTLEKDNFKAGVGKMKKGCSSCSIGSRCLKYKENEDRIEDSVTPIGAWGRGQQEQEQAGSPLPLEEPKVTPLSPPPSLEIKRGRKKEPDTEKRRHSFRHPSSSPPKTTARDPKSRTASLREPAIQAPLREAAGAAGPIKLKVPLSMGDLDVWKLVAKGYRGDPAGAAK